MFSGSVDVGFVFALPFHHGDIEPDGVGVSTREEGGRMLRSNRGMCFNWNALVAAAETTNKL